MIDVDAESTGLPHHRMGGWTDRGQLEDLAEAVLAGQPRAVAKAISLVESGDDLAAALMEWLLPRAGRGHMIGLTGAPGAGKSSLIAGLAREFRARGRSVGVIAVDPTSPFSGGSVLGDRIRMQDLATDPGVFVRSMASRCRSGGLAAAVDDAAVILRASGKDEVLVETVGVGQGELEVAGAVQTVIVVLTPGMGDEIQSLKAGILEVAHIFVVHKADLPGAELVARSLLTLGDGSDAGWSRPVIQTSLFPVRGIAELADAVDRHGQFLASRRYVAENEIRRSREAILAMAEREMRDRLESTITPESLERLAATVAAGKLDLRHAAQETVRLFFASYDRLRRKARNGVDEDETAEVPRSGIPLRRVAANGNRASAL